jgi:hypothetical protein
MGLQICDECGTLDHLYKMGGTSRCRDCVPASTKVTIMVDQMVLTPDQGYERLSAMPWSDDVFSAMDYLESEYNVITPFTGGNDDE